MLTTAKLLVKKINNYRFKTAIMNKNFRYTTLVFPQKVEDNVMHLNIVLLSRNRDPFDPMDPGLKQKY